MRLNKHTSVHIHLNVYCDLSTLIPALKHIAIHFS